MENERGPERLVAFSDAVVAIAITLVVLPLVDTARDGDNETVAGFFNDNLGAVAAAALSFIVIASLWRVHHTVFGRFSSATGWMVRVNFLWLAAIAFLPLPTVLLVEASAGDRLGAVLYIATMLVATSAMSVIGKDARHHAASRRGKVDPLTEAAEDDPGFRELIEKLNHLAQGPAEPVESHDDDGVTLPKQTRQHPRARTANRRG